MIIRCPGQIDHPLLTSQVVENFKMNTEHKRPTRRNTNQMVV